MNYEEDTKKVLKGFEEVINMRTEAGVDLESSEVLSMISKHKIW